MDAHKALIVELGGQQYRIDRPWGILPRGAGRVSDVACDANGHVFVLLRRDSTVDPEAPAVIELAPDGRCLAAWGESIVDGHMLAIGCDGYIYVVDRDAHEIKVFNARGQQIGGLGERHRPNAPFNHPSGIAFSAAGLIYVADGYGASRVHQFTASGTLLQTWGEPGDGPGQFSTPHGIWVMTDGRVAVTDRENDRLQIFAADGAHLLSIGGFYGAMDVWQGMNSGLLVTDRVPRLSLLNANGELVDRCRPVLNGAHGLIGDTAGNLYLAEIEPSRVTRLTPLGEKRR